jgi:hypothetical protein
MKRFAIFVCLGPAIGLLALALPLVLAGKSLPDASIITGGLMMAYTVGLMPAAVAGVGDMLLANWLTPLYRALAAGIVGAVATSLFLTAVFGSIGFYGLFGLVPAAVCSWLSEKAT